MRGIVTESTTWLRVLPGPRSPRQAALLQASATHQARSACRPRRQPVLKSPSLPFPPAPLKATQGPRECGNVGVPLWNNTTTKDGEAAQQMRHDRTGVCCMQSSGGKRLDGQQDRRSQTAWGESRQRVWPTLQGWRVSSHTLEKDRCVEEGLPLAFFFLLLGKTPPRMTSDAHTAYLPKPKRGS